MATVTKRPLIRLFGARRSFFALSKKQSVFLPWPSALCRKARFCSASSRRTPPPQSTAATTRPVRVRFAPSPTGALHLGGLRTALFNYIYAKKNNGQFLLRIEDTDQARVVPGAKEKLTEILEWSGIIIDEGPSKPSSCGPFEQSKRLHLYREHIQRLVASKAAFRCFCSTESTAEVRAQNRVKNNLLGCIRRCQDLTSEQIDAKNHAGETFVVRLKAPTSDVPLAWEDGAYGRISFPSASVNDLILLKSDGYPTYHFANVVDDHLMGITHVLRGEEWIPSTPKHLHLYASFGWQPPKFVHLPLLLNSDRTKLSKRSGHVDAESYKERGYVPGALINFISLLGWNPGTTQELFTMEQLVEQFTLDRIGSSASIVELARLDWFNKQHLKMMWGTDAGRQYLINGVRVRLRQEYSDIDLTHIGAESYLEAVINMMLERATTVQDFVTIDPILYRECDYDTDVSRTMISKVGSPTAQTMLHRFLETLESDHREETEKSMWGDLDSARKFVADFAKDHSEINGLKKLQVMLGIRWALTGTKQGASLAEYIHVFGPKKVSRRIRAALVYLREVPYSN